MYVSGAFKYIVITQFILKLNLWSRYIVFVYSLTTSLWPTVVLLLQIKALHLTLLLLNHKTIPIDVLKKN